MKSLFSLSFFLLCFFALPAWGQTAKEYFDKAQASNNYEEKIVFYDKAIELGYSKVYHVYTSRGFAKHCLERYEEAIEDYNTSLKLNPSYARAYNNRSASKIKLGEYKKAIEDCNVALSLNFDKPHFAYNNRSYAYMKLRNYGQALKDWEMMLAVAPKGYIPYGNVGLVCKNLSKRFALIVGNNTYEQMNPLTNAINDSKAIEARLTSLGFEVIRIENADKATFEKKIGEFSQKLKSGGTGLFYYAGHGVQYDNKNYLLPADADTTAQSCISVDVIQNAMENREDAVNILILDACRSNARGEKDKQKTFVKPSNDARGSVLAFSTSPENIALDGSPECPRNSVYTCELLKNMKKGVKLEDVFKRTREGVIKQSQNFQIPWEHSSLVGEFEF